MKILPEHKKILALRLRGESDRKICSELNISDKAFKDIVRGEVFETALGLALDMITGEIPYHPAVASKQAISKMKEKPEQIKVKIAEDDIIDPKIRLQALRDLEDRGFGKPREHVVLEDVWSILFRVSRGRLDQGMEE